LQNSIVKPGFFVKGTLKRTPDVSNFMTIKIPPLNEETSNFHSDINIYHAADSILSIAFSLKYTYPVSKGANNPFPGIRERH
jgi:hypothetical protein